MNGIRKYSNEMLRAYLGLAEVRKAKHTYNAITRELVRREQAAPKGEVA